MEGWDLSPGRVVEELSGLPIRKMQRDIMKFGDDVYNTFQYPKVKVHTVYIFGSDHHFHPFGQIIVVSCF